MGEIVFWTLVRITLSIPVIWLLKDYINTQLWWSVSFVIIFVFVFYPAVIKYRQFQDKNKNIFNDTLCSTCRHFDPTAVLCIKLDKHPTEKYIPCEGLEWEPLNKSY